MIVGINNINQVIKAKNNSWNGDCVNPIHERRTSMFRGNFLRFFVVLLFLGFSNSSIGQTAKKGDSLTAQKRELYFMIIFSQEGSGHEPWLSHTFATFVKATGTGSDRNQYRLEHHTISWLPASRDVRLLRLGPEPGKNFSREDTLRWARSLNVRISMLGPYQIQKELYERAVRQVQRLNQGKIAYKAIDGRFRPDVASNCFHAISDIDADNGLLQTGTAHGDDASSMVVMHLKRWLIRPEEVHDWVAQRLGVSDSGIVHLKMDRLANTQ
jgi:hypothetical protein